MKRTPTSRVDRLLGSMGYGSRAEMARMAKAGGIVLDGADLTDVSRRIAVTPDLPSRMEIDGEPLDPVQGLVILLNKPLGMTCSHKEEGALVYDILPGRWRRRDPAISTIGRLDKETSGLLLLTDDGDLLHRVISPKRHVAKVYRAGLARPPEHVAVKVAGFPTQRAGAAWAQGRTIFCCGLEAMAMLTLILVVARAHGCSSSRVRGKSNPVPFT